MSAGPGTSAAEPRFFADAAAFRGWLQAHHAEATELLVGLRRTGSGVPSMTWSQSVREALCFGWIDGVRRSLGETAYTIRFTPRRPRSTWSAVNIALVGELEAAGLMHEAGRAAFAARIEARSRTYSHERAAEPELTAAEWARLREDAACWAFLEAVAPSYRRAALHGIVSAKRAETRARRLEELRADSAAGRRIRRLSW